MRLVNLDATIGDVSGVIDPGPYLDVLPELKLALPEGARGFATDPDHYDFGGRRCVKDLKISTVVVSSGDTSDPDDRSNADSIELVLRHNCWKHEEDLTIRYLGVQQVSLNLRTVVRWPQWTDEHVVILDEILPSPEGCSHEIAFHGRGSLLVISRDLIATWSPSDCPAHG